MTIMHNNIYGKKRSMTYDKTGSTMKTCSHWRVSSDLNETTRFSIVF